MRNTKLFVCLLASIVLTLSMAWTTQATAPSATESPPQDVTLAIPSAIDTPPELAGLAIQAVDIRSITLVKDTDIAYNTAGPTKDHPSFVGIATAAIQGDAYDLTTQRILDSTARGSPDNIPVGRTLVGIADGAQNLLC